MPERRIGGLGILIFLTGNGREEEGGVVSRAADVRDKGSKLRVAIEEVILCVCDSAAQTATTTTSQEPEEAKEEWSRGGFVFCSVD